MESTKYGNTETYICPWPGCGYEFTDDEALIHTSRPTTISGTFTREIAFCPLCRKEVGRRKTKGESTDGI